VAARVRPSLATASICEPVRAELFGSKAKGFCLPRQSQDLVDIDKTRLKNLVDIDKTTQKKFGGN
jgi:hypothetical protein